MRRMIEVVDDFYQDPEAVRECALNDCEWTEDGADALRFESARTREPLVRDGVIERIAALTGESAGALFPRSGSGYFAFSGDLDGEPPEPRLDTAEWVAVIHLAPPDPHSGGISFFQTREQDGRAPNTWTETLHVSMRFNRMVLYRASAIYHREDPGSGSESGRVIQSFSFDKALG